MRLRGQPQDQGVAEVRSSDGGGMYEGILGSLGAFDDRYVMDLPGRIRETLAVEHLLMQ